MKRSLAWEPGAEHSLKVRLKRLPPGSFDYLLIDCPPSLGLLTVNALTAVSEVFDLSGFSRIIAVHPDRATALTAAPQKQP